MEVKFTDERQQQTKDFVKQIKNLKKLEIPRRISLIVLVILAINIFMGMPILNPVYIESTVFFILLVVTILVFLTKKSYYIIIGFVVVALMFAGDLLLTNELMWNQKYYNLLGDVKVEKYAKNPPAIDNSKLPVVDAGLAANLGDKKLGEDVGIGSQFTTGEYYFIKTEEDLAWVAPLEPRDVFKWLSNTDGAPGYIYVSATDPNDVRLVNNIDGKDLKIKYSNNAFLLSNIKRHLYLNGYMTTGLTDYSFEIDDDGQPFWVVTTYAPSFNIFGGAQATGVAIVNAATGEISDYKISEIEKLPKWVDRIQPIDLLTNQIDYWGKYKNGFINTLFAQKEVVKTTPGYSYAYINDEPYMYTGLTSVQDDQATVGMMLINLRTKAATFYEQTGATEQAAQNSAQGQVQQFGYRASFPVLLNEFGQATYFMPLLDNQGLIKQYSFVSVVNYNIVGIGDTIDKARQNYYDKLKQNKQVTTSDASLISKTATIDRINYIDGTYYLTLIDDKRLYNVDQSINQFLAVTKSGDKVTIKFVDSPDTIEIAEFKNDNLE
ncbi:MAG: hypothetical protein ACRCUP_01890 [Mycoplasmatales bacterium]